MNHAYLLLALIISVLANIYQLKYLIQMQVIDRIKLFKTLEGISYVELCEKTGIEKKRLENVINEKAKIRHEEIEAIGNAWPEFKLWLAYGDEIPEAGQISPMTKKTMSELRTQGKA